MDRAGAKLILTELRRLAHEEGYLVILVEHRIDYVLSVKDISVSFGKRQVLRSISLDVHEGEKLMLVGDNGCGKTTLTRVMARLLKPDSGTVESIFPAVLRN